MKTSIFTYTLLVILLMGIAGCDVVDPERIDDPNNPSVNEVLENANQDQLQNLISGLEVRHRSSTVGFLGIIGSFGREIYPMRASDPRNLGDLIGLAEDSNAEEDPSYRGLGSVWTTPYLAIKQANVVIQSVQNTDNIDEQQKNGFLGVTKTIKAFQYLIPLLTQSKENGIRIDVNDPLNPGPFVPFGEALPQVRALLDEALTHLQAAGNSFAFELTEGFSEFNTPSTFENLNRAIDARTALYAKDWEGALQSLEEAEPFFELSSGEATMNKGAYFVYTGPPDVFNPLHYPRNAATNQIEMVHPSMITDAEAGDERVANKFFERDNPITQQGLSSKYQDDRFESNTSPVPWLRNEELILIYAEANTQLDNFPEANRAINFVRNTWGLNNFAGTTKSEIIDQLLYERRYSLWYEFGHRWFDAKRYDRLDQLPTDGGQIFRYYARPLSEINWEDFNS